MTLPDSHSPRRPRLQQKRPRAQSPNSPRVFPQMVHWFCDWCEAVTTNQMMSQTPAVITDSSRCKTWDVAGRTCIVAFPHFLQCVINC